MNNTVAHLCSYHRMREYITGLCNEYKLSRTMQRIMKQRAFKRLCRGQHIAYVMAIMLITARRLNQIQVAA